MQEGHSVVDQVDGVAWGQSTAWKSSSNQGHHPRP